jgi:phosphate transport system substrate-binding protein
LIRSTRLARLFVTVTAAVAIGVGGSLAVATAASAKAKAKAPKGGVETPSAGTVTETGSSLMYPLFNLWAGGYSTKHSSVTVSTASTGSGTGLADAANGTVDIGASDAYLAPSALTTTPTLLNIPLAISAQLAAYNIPGVTAHLVLSGKVLSKIYQGTITTWNDPAIAALNPSVTLPSIPIVTLHRSDGSGDTFLWSTFLSDADPSGWGKTIGFNTTISWPNAPGALGENGNSGMLAGCKATVGCIAYVGISYLTQALQAGLGYAALVNGKGQNVLPTPVTIATEAAGFTKKTPPTGTISMEYGKVKNGYPIVNYEYAIVNSNQSSSSTAKDIRSLLEWIINSKDGNASSILNQVNFQPLPATVVAQSLKQIKTIQ